MSEDGAQALAALRRFNYEHIYLRPASISQAESVVRLLRALVEAYGAAPELLPGPGGDRAGSDPAIRSAVGYVAGMTDRFACQQATRLLGWSPGRLPRGLDLSSAVA
jgi:dGTPase